MRRADVVWLAAAIWSITLVMTVMVRGVSSRTRAINDTAPSKFNGDLIREISVEKELVRVLMRDYRRVGKVGRPVLNISEPVLVSFGLGLIQMEVDEKNNMLIISTWARYRWRDEYLQWDPSMFGGIETLRLPPDQIWIPDIMLYNTATTDEFVRDALAVVTSDGSVTWYPHRMFQSSCSFDVTNFPFDNQTCNLIFGSWTHVYEEVDLELAFPTGLDLSTFQKDYKDSSKWDIINVKVTRFVAGGQYAVIQIEIHLRRKMMFSSYILTVPAVFLSFLTLVVFALPSDDVEKCVLGLTIFGNLLLLLLILVESAPPTASAVPLLGVFYCFTTVIVILSVFLSTLIVKLGNPDLQGSRKHVPKWVRKFMFDWVSRVLLMGRYKSHPRFRRKVHNHVHESSISDPITGHTLVENNTRDNGSLRVPLRLHSYDAVLPPAEENNSPRGDAISSSSLDQQKALVILHDHVMKIRLAVDRISQRQKDTQDKELFEQELHGEWKYLATVVDRLFFLVYLVLITLSLAFLFPRLSFE